MRAPDWLGHLRTDDRGRPVPFVNRWGVEDVNRISIRWDRAVGANAVFHDDSRETKPDFRSQDMARQRACVYRSICQVCGLPVPKKRRVLVLDADLKPAAQLYRTPQLVVSEPWLHPRCADFAVAVCPALIRRGHDENLRVVPVDGVPIQLIASVGVVEGPLRELSQRVRPVMWAKILLPTEVLA